MLLYGLSAQRLLGRMGWGSQEARERKAAHDSKGFVVGSGIGLNAMNAGTYSPQPAAAVNSPQTMSELLANPPCTKRFAPRPSVLRPDFLDVDVLRK